MPPWRAVEEATTNTFTPAADMAGYTVRAVVRYADGLGTPGEHDKQEASASAELTSGNPPSLLTSGAG